MDPLRERGFGRMDIVSGLTRTAWIAGGCLLGADADDLLGTLETAFALSGGAGLSRGRRSAHAYVFNPRAPPAWPIERVPLDGFLSFAKRSIPPARCPRQAPGYGWELANVLQKAQNAKRSQASSTRIAEVAESLRVLLKERSA